MNSTRVSGTKALPMALGLVLAGVAGPGAEWLTAQPPETPGKAANPPARNKAGVRARRLKLQGVGMAPVQGQIRRLEAVLGKPLTAEQKKAVVQANTRYLNALAAAVDLTPAQLLAKERAATLAAKKQPK